MIKKDQETKYYLIQYENTQLYHDVTSVVQIDPWQHIVKGTGRNQRIGEDINCIGMKIKFWIANKLDRPNLLYRCIIGFFPRCINGTVLTGANVASYVYAQVDLGNGANPMIMLKNQDNGVKWVYDRVWRHEKGVSGTAAGVNKECHFTKKIWINMKGRQLKYAGASLPQGYVPVILLEPYDSQGTLITDNVASYAYQVSLYYKDS